MLETDKLFAGSVPENYDRYMVPLIFEPYAADMAQRAASLSSRAVLEIAARCLPCQRRRRVSIRRFRAYSRRKTLTLQTTAVSLLPIMPLNSSSEQCR